MASLRLEDVQESLLPDLGQALWGWERCSACVTGEACRSRACPSQRLRKLQRYFQFYEGLTLTYVDGDSAANRAFETHHDLLRAATLLKSNPSITRADFCQAISDASRQEKPGSEELLRASTIAVQVLTMIDCSPLYQSSILLETGTFRVQWRDGVPFVQYLGHLFPVHSHPIFSFADSNRFVDSLAELRAVNLMKHLDITFRPTHDIRNHLRLDRRQRVVEIYHHTSFIKEQLRATKDTEASTASQSIQKLSSNRFIPLSELKSKSLLVKLVDELSLDPDIQQFEFSSIRRAGEDNVSFVLLADRLAELYEELQYPRPRGWLARQMERKSGARYMMMATMIGVVFAVFLGLCSLAVSCYQAWIAYQSWKHPVAPPTS
ncbi:hypothetical protein CP533_1149 [Ophiocordyceps camponoti-saundersi (nom. inval.)]|nr:hypothetical protein CP533_1149 [Ophiocordyceps camponoti-saundersi (nom. inval.)]